MFQRLYDRTLAIAEHRHATAGLAGVAFLESSVFPIPPDVLLVPMVLADRARAWWLALVCTLASVVGGLAGYAIGLFLFQAVGEPILAFYGYMDSFAELRALYGAWGFWVVFAAGLTPIPYKVFTIASGVFTLNPAAFIVGSAVSRGLRFFAVSALIYYLGPPVRRVIERNVNLVGTALVVLLIAGFVAVRYGV
ncbi:membrane protein YqaA, SNARE-associated domain [Limimonas halophila]|uniref:Membrane protein YqaA, SNARE-associated domain n=1 Tax=Limimonas halophila TaxID=1082479 RepID=A0A1G7SUT8_9PROT|nr:YqaA family protein [Limimonas halophila]SDG26209.1 membrane protein YqaA, SNARE-associated domain [Limimonas halophila]